jgi:DNA polymerase III subunit epsilon
VHVEGEWSSPLGGARKHLMVHDAVNESRANLVPFDDRRPIRPLHQPAR